MQIQDSGEWVRINSQDSDQRCADLPRIASPDMCLAFLFSGCQSCSKSASCHPQLQTPQANADLASLVKPDISSSIALASVTMTQTYINLYSAPIASDIGGFEEADKRVFQHENYLNAGTPLEALFAWAKKRLRVDKHISFSCVLP